VETVKSIDEAIRILNCLKRESKKRKRESDISSVEVPKEFKCTLSKTIMIDPLIISSGQTYEKRYITEWLNHNPTCPKTKELLSQVHLTPNHLINDLITQWCLVNNKVDRPKPQPSDFEIATEMFTGDIEPLLQRISSPYSSVEDQIEAAKELALQTSKFVNIRDFFVAKFPDSITRLLTPLSVLGDDVDSNPELQENIITSLFNMSTFEKNKTLLAENPQVIPLLAKSLKQGTVVTRRNAAATLMSLSDIDSNKIIIGNSEALKALIDLIGDSDDLSATNEAANAILNLCFDESENCKKAISLGLASAVTKNIKAGRNVDELLAVLVMISPHERVVEEMDNLGVIYDLLSILRKTSCLVTCENVVVIVHNMYVKSRERSIMKTLAEEENQHKTFTKLASQESVIVVGRAQGILQGIRAFAAGK
ncbi:Armadillo, partial [Arabidopsis suecica]